MYKLIPYNLNHATTLSFWISLIILRFPNNYFKRLIYSYIFGVSITGLNIQYDKKKNRKSLIQNIIHYVTPLSLSLYLHKNLKYKKINIFYQISLIIFYNFYLKIKDTNSYKIYGNKSVYYQFICFYLSYFYYNFKLK